MKTRIEQAAREWESKSSLSESIIEKMDTYELLEVAENEINAFKAGYKLAHDEAMDGFEEWMNESVESEMGRISSRRHTVTMEQELCNKFVWQQAKLSSQKEIARLEAEIEKLNKELVDEFEAHKIARRKLRVECEELKSDLKWALHQIEHFRINTDEDTKMAWLKLRKNNLDKKDL